MPEDLEAQPEAAAEVAEELPDWLAETASAEPEITPEVVEAAPEVAVPEVVAEAVEELPEGIPAEVISEAAEEVPDWMKETVAPAPEPVAPAWVPEETKAAEIAEEPLIPAEAETAPEEPPAEAAAPLLDINAASLSQLEALPGIGFVLGQSILSFRETYGRFTTVDDLEKISGIGPGIVNEIRHLITTGLPAEAVLPKTGPLPADKVEAEFVLAQQAFAEGNTEAAVEHYNTLVKKGQQLERVIADLQQALYRFPVDVNIWQTLGDAHLRSDRLQEALEAYIKAEELLR
jgi:competence ComEA-like helix-hairpin-helix protein